MPNALFVVSEEGYWAEECVDPLQTLSEEGFDVDVATPTGGPPVVDETSLDPDNPFVDPDVAETAREVHETDERMQNPMPIATADAADYDAVVFPGGHGTDWDVNQDKHARQLLVDALAGDEGKAYVLCHAVGLLAFARDEDGELVAEGRDVTGFPNEWEQDIVDENDLMPDGRKLPYWVEDEVTAAGANWDAEVDAETSVTVDGDLVTARGPASSHDGALALLDELSVERSA